MTDTTKHRAAIRIEHDEMRGLLSVEHDGTIGWDELQAIKNTWWGPETAAIEVYPPDRHVVNSLPMRHLWRLGPNDFWPDLTGCKPHGALSLKERDLMARMQVGLFGAEDGAAQRSSSDSSFAKSSSGSAATNTASTCGR
ncbi:DUF7694 domain-containing protein [Mesorhizobium xinjiangense]|uniref:DUF7694 domain-containing protein n=1 Tax=Mesorhizobium xinjiangense TaxID=2678685 RepID=UPI0018DB1E8E|nr:hypothetical protein [Mesorhizobium xinjiangense]